jgi:hypothetical protein
MARTYRMTPAQSDEWILGNQAAAAVEHEICDDLQEDKNTDDVDVLLDDGSVAFSLWHNTTMQWHEVGRRVVQGYTTRND